MLIIISCIPIIIIIAVVLINFFNKRLLLNQLRKLQDKGFVLWAETKKYSDENNFILQYECQDIKSFLFGIEDFVKNNPNNLELQVFLNQHQELFTELNERIERKKQQWTVYSEFKSNVEFLKINLNNKKNELVQKGQVLILKAQEYEEEISKKIEDTVNLIDTLNKELTTLEKASFTEFNFYILEDIQKEYTDLLEKIKHTIKEYKYFFKNITLKIIGIERKAIFYISLEEDLERRKKIRKGEITVSYKTFKDAYEGKKYKKDTYIAGKRSVNTQNIQLEFQVDENICRFERELNDEDFAMIYRQLSIEKKYLVTDEDGLPFELKLSNLEIIAFAKEENSFEINYYLAYFEELGLSEFLVKYENQDLAIVS